MQCNKAMSRIALALAFMVVPVAAPAITLDDFVPPVQGGAADPAGPVKADRDVVTAETMQDGLSYAYKEILNEDGQGVRTVATKTGMGVIAAATVSYKRYENINATMLSKRGAYVRAFTDAQRRMVQYFKGFENNCKAAVSSNRLVLDTGVEGAANAGTTVDEVCSETVKGVLAAYVTYQVADNDADHEVTVALASSTKTRSAVDRPGGAVVVSTDPKRAFEHIAKEIALGVVPPLGAKLIHNPDNGEAIVIGFGSAIIRQNRDKAMMREMKDMARRQAETRANSALVSFLNGSDVYWQGGFDEKQIESSQQFDIPTDENGKPLDPVVFDDTRSVFLNAVRQSDDYKVVTSGNLPPGIKSKTFQSEDGFWMNSITIYMASATAEAAKAGRENEAAAGKLNGARQGARPPEGRTMQIEGGVAEGAANPKGPTGRAVRGNDF